MRNKSLLSVLLLLVSLHVLFDVTHGKTKEDKKGSSSSLDHGIFDWVRSAPGGICNPAQEFRKDAVTGVTGVFAKQDIPKGTVLVSVPWSHVIPSDDPTEEGQLCCGLVERLKREWKLGSKSQFAPYIEYLKTTTPHSSTALPSTWSKEGKALLQAILGEDVRPVPTPSTPSKTTMIPPEGPFKWLTNEWYPMCGGNAKDKAGIQAALVVIQRSDDHILIPGYDMYNHRNGKQWLNTRTTVNEGKNHITVATRDIRAGEQIYITYNMCRGCVGRRHGYGTGEILRDYGFVEMLPQRFHYQTENDLVVQFDIDEVEQDKDGTKRLELTWDDELGPPPMLKHSQSMILPLLGFFRRQIRRLRKIRNLQYRTTKPGKIPQKEWDMCWEFQLANIRAMTLAIQSLEKELELESTVNVTDDLGTHHLPHYDSLGAEPDDLSYADETCDNEYALAHVGHRIVDSDETHYQELTFQIHPETKNVVMELDSITQIASVYRPQYHEYSVHAAARYLDSVKRVIFIGGGDSMLLHEVLKYPELELVVGLELDQTVTRKSFKYFLTQPHFDDPRVEWWFGDATKSLLLLPKDYWQSFDLVLVDLSETVMSFSVTDELDVFDALALLLKPEGILVKNELYMEVISQTFDHSVQVCYQSPVICDQVMTMGSNKVDFMHSPVKDHGVETLLYTPLVTSENRYDFLHDYRQNDARAQGKCNLEKTPSSSELKEQTKSAGIMEIVDAEETSVPLDESLVAVLEQAAQQEDFHLSGKSVYDKNILMILMEEGYILARLFSDKKYCSMDINVWGSFHKLKSLTASLTKALGSKVVSNYRVVVGGMYGSSTWSQDRDLIGPQMAQARDCSERQPKGADAKDVTVEQALVKVSLETSISTLVSRSDALAVVICGSKEDDCLAKEVFSKSTKIATIVQLVACPEIASAEPETLYDCEIAFLAEWKKALGGRRADILALDATVPKEMLQIVNSILHDDVFRKAVISPTNLVLTWSVQPAHEPWREQFLDRYRKQHKKDPISRAGYRILSGSVGMELGVVSAGDASVAYHLNQVETSLQKQFPDATIELHIIHGGKYAYWDPWDPQEFLQSDYDDAPALAQYFGQQPIAQHSIYQLEPIEDAEYEFDSESLNKSFQEALKHVEFECPTKFSVNNVGKGCVVVCLNPEFGSVVLTWDGRQHVDISYYLLDDDFTELQRFIMYFRYTTEFQLDVALRDDMPRGIGRVVNFKDDTMLKEERDVFFANLFLDEDELAEEMYYARALGPTQEVKEGSCSVPGADQSTCWPDPPPL